MKNTREYEWADINAVVAGRTVTGLRGVKYGSKQEKELVHGKGNKPCAIQHGNKTYDGELTLLQSEYIALREAFGGDVLDGSFNIVVSYGNPTQGDVVTTDILVGVEITEDTTEWKQGDKFQEKSLPFIYLDQKAA